jgi:hypothetical protein
MDSFSVVIVLTFLGFFALAAALLVPIYLFLKKEEKTAELWTREHLGNAVAGEAAPPVDPRNPEVHVTRNGHTGTDKAEERRGLQDS